jgi:uncharacterized protein YvpB
MWSISYREHSVLVVGYDENNVYVNDPLADQPYTAVSRDSFEDSWIQMGKQAISYRSIRYQNLRLPHFLFQSSRFLFRET